MDKYVVFGLLLIACLGKGQEMYIDLNSPVMQDENVTITCTWILQHPHFIIWYRMTETNETTQIGKLTKEGFHSFLSHVSYESHNYDDPISQHLAIKLIGAGTSDEGNYWCYAESFLWQLWSAEETLAVIVPEATATAQTTALAYTASDASITSGDTNTSKEPTTVMSGMNYSEGVKGPQVGVVAGSVVGGVVLLLAVIVTVSMCICRRRRNKQDDIEMVDNDVYAGVAGGSNPVFNELDGKSDTRLSQNAEGPYSNIPDQTDSANISSRAANPTASGQPDEQATHMSKAVQGSEPQTDQTASAKSSASSERLNHHAQPKGQTKEGSKTANGTDTHNAQSDSSKKKAGKKRNGKPESKRKVTQSVPPTKTGKATTEVQTRADSSIEGKTATHGPQYANIQQLRLPDIQPGIQPRPVNAADEGKCAEDVQYDTIDDSTLKLADKDVNLTAGNTPTDKAERKQVVHVSPDKQTATYLGQEVQYTQVDKTKKNNARQNNNQQEGSHYAEVAPTDDGKTESVIVRTVPDTQYSAVKLIAPGDQTVDTDSD